MHFITVKYLVVEVHFNHVFTISQMHFQAHKNIIGHSTFPLNH